MANLGPAPTEIAECPPSILMFLATSSVGKKLLAQDQKRQERKKRRDDIWELDEKDMEIEEETKKDKETKSDEDGGGRETRRG